MDETYLRRYLNDPTTVVIPTETGTPETPVAENSETTYMRRYLNDPAAS